MWSGAIIFYKITVDQLQLNFSKIKNWQKHFTLSSMCSVPTFSGTDGLTQPVYWLLFSFRTLKKPLWEQLGFMATILKRINNNNYISFNPSLSETKLSKKTIQNEDTQKTNTSWIYTINCSECDKIYIGQTKKSN